MPMKKESKERAVELDSKIAALIPPESVYLMLWGEPERPDGKGDQQFRMQTLGNTSQLASLRIMLAYMEQMTEDLDPEVVYGAIVSSRLGDQMVNSLKKRLVADLMLMGIPVEKVNEAN